MPAQILDAVCVRSSTAFPQGSMVGSDPAGGRACENTHAPTPSLGRPRAGSLPSPPERPVSPRLAGLRKHKTLPHQRIRGGSRVNPGRAES